MHQVIIVGAGPAGAYLAYLLSHEGISVLLLEKERFPRYKPCGGGITPKVIKLLDFDLNPVMEDTIYTVIFTHGWARPIAINADRPVVYTVSRERFDAFLLDKAKGMGAEVLEGVRVNNVEINEDKVSVHVDGVKQRGEVLVGADGALGIVARTLRLARNKRMALTLETEVPVSNERLSRNRGTIKADYGLVPAGYAWVFPKAEHLSLGVGSISPKLKALKPLLEKIIQAEGLESFSSALPERSWPIPINPDPRDLHIGRALVIGDAAGLADPFTGEGIHAALLSAHLAAEVIIDQIKQPRPDLRGYTHLVRERIGPEITNAFRLISLFYPASGLVHRLLQHRQGLANELFQVFAGDVTYAQLFASFRGVKAIMGSQHQ